jgi:glutaredoxin
MQSVLVELFGKPGCHLCDDAREIVETFLVGRPEVQLIERNILEDPELFETMRNDIPVVSVNGKVISRWRVDVAILEKKVEEASK